MSEVEEAASQCMCFALLRSKRGCAPQSRCARPVQQPSQGLPPPPFAGVFGDWLNRIGARGWLTAGSCIAAAPLIALSLLVPDYKQSFAALLVGFALRWAGGRWWGEGGGWCCGWGCCSIVGRSGCTVCRASPRPTCLRPTHPTLHTHTHTDTHTHTFAPPRTPHSVASAGAPPPR